VHRDRPERAVGEWVLPDIGHSALLGDAGMSIMARLTPDLPEHGASSGWSEAARFVAGLPDPTPDAHGGHLVACWNWLRLKASFRLWLTSQPATASLPVHPPHHWSTE